MRITEITEEDRITAALEHATEAIRVLRKKLDIATEALKRADALFADDRQRTEVINEALEQIENEQ